MSDNPNTFDRSNIITQFDFPVTKVENGITTIIKPANFLDTAEDISVVAVGEGDSAYNLGDYVKRAVRNLFCQGMRYLKILENQEPPYEHGTFMVFLQDNIDQYNTLTGLQMESTPNQVPSGQFSQVNLDYYTNATTIAQAIQQALKKEETVDGETVVTYPYDKDGALQVVEMLRNSIRFENMRYGSSPFFDIRVSNTDYYSRQYPLTLCKEDGTSIETYLNGIDGDELPSDWANEFTDLWLCDANGVPYIKIDQIPAASEKYSEWYTNGNLVMNDFPGEGENAPEFNKKNYEAWLANENSRLKAVNQYIIDRIKQALRVNDNKYYVDSLLADSLAKFNEAINQLILYNATVNKKVAENIVEIAKLYGVTIAADKIENINKKLPEITGNRFNNIAFSEGKIILTTPYETEYTTDGTRTDINASESKPFLDLIQSITDTIYDNETTYKSNYGDTPINQTLEQASGRRDRWLPLNYNNNNTEEGAEEPNFTDQPYYYFNNYVNNVVTPSGSAMPLCIIRSVDHLYNEMMEARTFDTTEVQVEGSRYNLIGVQGELTPNQLMTEQLGWFEYKKEEGKAAEIRRQEPNAETPEQPPELDAGYVRVYFVGFVKEDVTENKSGKVMIRACIEGTTTKHDYQIKVLVRQGDDDQIMNLSDIHYGLVGNAEDNVITDDPEFKELINNGEIDRIMNKINDIQVNLDGTDPVITPIREYTTTEESVPANNKMTKKEMLEYVQGVERAVSVMPLNVRYINELIGYLAKVLGFAALRLP